MSTSNTVNTLPFEFVDYASSPEDALANDIINQSRPNPADLTQSLVWCGSRTDQHRLKLSILNAARKADIPQLILPSIITLEDWVWLQQAPTDTVISESGKQLILVDALRDNLNFFQTTNPWPLAKELVNLFNECTHALIAMHAGEEVLRETLHKSYGYNNQTTSNISRESEIVHQLWLAYHEQLQARGYIDPVEYYCQRLIDNEITVDKSLTHIYVVNKARIYNAEAKFFARINASHSLKIYTARISCQQQIIHNHPHLRYTQGAQTSKDKSNPREQVLEIIYERSSDTYERINRLAKQCPENIFANWISLYTCDSVETHVNAVCLQTKKWLLDNIPNVGIVVSDRLLARRIRAVLEQHGIQASDLGGWTLSTTSAATAIDILLDAIENNFKKESLLDLLSNPTLSNNIDNESDYLAQTYQFKKYLKKHRNSATDNLETMTSLARQCFDSDNNICLEVLDVIGVASNSLIKYRRSGEYQVSRYTELLLDALKSLGIYASLEKDIAGLQLLQTLSHNLQSLRTNTIKVQWTQWRQWLNDLLEHNYFIPADIDKRVTLCSIEHINNIKFDAVIIAGVEESRIMNSKQRTFFNEKVCYELGLPTSQETNAINFVRIRQLLQQTNKVLLSAESEKNGEPQIICSWVEILKLFVQQAYKYNLYDNTLDMLIQAYQTKQQAKYDFSDLKTFTPTPSAPKELIPSRISATQYQSLIDCPYQYFAKYILSLQEFSTADEFEASDYGMLVHQILLEFHFHSDNNTASAFQTKNHSRLIKELSELSVDIFMHAPFPKATKQGWCQRWLRNIPDYIEWATERARHWRTFSGESIMQSRLDEQFSLHGQIDRIDSNKEQLAVIDYKTGSTIPTKKNVINGEVVQLPFYALLDDNIKQAEYVSLGNRNEVRTSTRLDEEELNVLKPQHRLRMKNLFNSLLNESKLPAQGDQSTCRVCEYHGLCRKQHWN